MASTCNCDETQELDPAGIVLSTAISNDTVSDELLEQCSQEGCLDVPDVDGKTPLMLACLKGLENVVKFLLENGANPNSKSLKEGNTPLHYSCMLEDVVGTDYFQKQLYKQKEGRTPQISIIKLLVKHGAAVQSNLDGWTPSCIAAFYLLKDFVDYFLSMGDGVTKEEKIKASAILGVVSATVGRNPTEDAFGFLYRAIEFQVGSGFEKGDNEPSELSACFSHISLRECRTLDEIRSVESSESALKAHAFLVGERLFPPSLKQRYLYPYLVYFAYLIMYLEEDVERGFQIFSHVLELERHGEAIPGTVLLQLSYAYDFQLVFHAFGDEPEPLVRQLSKDVLHSYIQVLENTRIDCLMDLCQILVERFSLIVFSEARSSYSVPYELKSNLRDIENLMSIIRCRIHREKPAEFSKMPSLTFEIMSHVKSKDGRVLFDCESYSRQFTLVKIRYLVLWALQYDGASYRHRTSGNTLLHLLAMSTFAAVYNGCVTRVMRCIKDLAEAFVHHGCPIDAVNSDGETARDIMQNVGLTRSNFKLIETVMSPPITVLQLQELAVRVIIRHKINYKNVLPTRLHQNIEWDRPTDADFSLKVLGSLKNKESRFESDSSGEETEDDSDDTSDSYHSSDSNKNSDDSESD
ncbi:protein fem-1 homolog B-like [Lytechinus pictus]|uniref:protein fem-1 homolog B-like n=1 Tax=Lytechinus pictus TaxID=7653 RepID=UPI0030B9FA3C